MKKRGMGDEIENENLQKIEEVKREVLRVWKNI